MSKMCDKCPLRGAYEKNKKSFIGRLWRWHINFCPGWNRYYKSLDAAQRAIVKSECGFERD